MGVDMKRSREETSNPVQKYDVYNDTNFEEIIEEVSLDQVNRLYLRDFATDAQRLMQGIKTLLDMGIFNSLTISDIDSLADLASAPHKKSNQLKSIYLSTPNIAGEKVKYIAEILRENIKLTQLNLASNCIRNSEAECIAATLKENTTLTQLNLDDNYIGPPGIKYIAAALKENTTLTWLNLEKNHIGDLGAKDIADALEVNTTLTQLDLTGDSIKDPGARYIADALKVNKSLTYLTLGGHLISNTAGRYIVDCLKVNKALLHIDLHIIYIHKETINQADTLCANNKSHHSELVKFINHNANNIIPINYKAFDTLTVTEEQEQDGFTKIMFCTLLSKVSFSYLKTQCESKLVGGFKYLVDASFFKIFGICKEFQNDHPFKNIPEEVMVQITHNLPPVVWKSVIIQDQNAALELAGDIDACQAVESVE
jgi:Ran GTPase-activating protein (RanGAP) involved in mRNA processing and transport